MKIALSHHLSSSPHAAMQSPANLKYFATILLPLILTHLIAYTLPLHWSSRLMTSLSSLKKVSQLSEETVESFLGSFSLFQKNVTTFSASSDELAMIRSYYQVIHHLCSVGDFEVSVMSDVCDVLFVTGAHD
jgi:hypothetical protein